MREKFSYKFSGDASSHYVVFGWLAWSGKEDRQGGSSINKEVNWPFSYQSFPELPEAWGSGLWIDSWSPRPHQSLSGTQVIWAFADGGPREHSDLQWLSPHKGHGLWGFDFCCPFCRQSRFPCPDCPHKWHLVPGPQEVWCDIVHKATTKASDFS